MNERRKIEVFMPCDPPRTTNQTGRTAIIGGRIMRYDTKQQKQAKATLVGALLLHQPPTPLSGAIAVVIHVIWPYLKSDVQRKKDQGRTDHIFHTSYPDIDNWLKDFQDTLAALRFIDDDKNIVSCAASKWRGPEPGIRLLITELGEPSKTMKALEDLQEVLSR